MKSAPPDGALDAELRRRFGEVAGVAGGLVAGPGGLTRTGGRRVEAAVGIAEPLADAAATVWLDDAGGVSASGSAVAREDDVAAMLDAATLDAVGMVATPPPLLSLTTLYATTHAIRTATTAITPTTVFLRLDSFWET